MEVLDPLFCNGRHNICSHEKAKRGIRLLRRLQGTLRNC
jgi:hypothetical protein